MTQRRTRHQRGAGLVEIALVTIPFFTLVLGTITAGYLVFLYNSTAYMAQQGARWASVRGSSSGSPATATAVATYVDGLAAGFVPGSLTVTTTWSPNNSPGSTVSVQVAYAAQALATLGFPSSSFTISSSSSTTISQ